jgi:hypothetical protein
MCLRVSYKKKCEIFKIGFADLKSPKKEAVSGVGSGSTSRPELDPDPLVRGTDPRIRTKCHGSPTLVHFTLFKID